ncbi:helix-turn-helix transcriptional regulator [Xylocopilactobacillus apicola]|uniref:Transcriptional regulator n=1 Tax=Xylocopilactobacillus apicola TaxID=2932184 RepID=A0AAU9DA77_9LACO|nr:helix-turn-helix transcriptional regulator [Xylocopilactobacillus apicola]BDR59285.1 transcriptional regulator [Xylocopilactobacillus apicola]
MIITNEVQYWRKKRNFTQEELAVKVGVTRKTIGSLEKGNYTPSLLLGFKIAQVLNVDINEIFRLEDN